MTPEDLLAEVAQFYLESGDFNGYPVPFGNGSNIDMDSLRTRVSSLVRSGKLYVNYGDRHENPHILAFEPEAMDKQLQKLETMSLAGACLYPTAAYMQTMANPSDYAGRPYTLELAQGQPQLGFHFFDLSTLETYRNDPRYYYRFDISGTISVHGEHFEQPTMDERDQVILQSFGLAHSKDKYWALVAFRRYLHSLSPEHQQIWKAKQEPDDLEKFAPHSDYWRMSMGDWGLKLSLFSAFLEEMKQVNKLAELMGRPPLFREEYDEDKRPRDFGYL